MLGLHFKALSDSLSSEASQASHSVKEATKEAKEAETYSLYNKALGLLSNGDTEKAEAVFRDLIDHDFLQEAMDLLEEKGKDAIHPGLQLLYPIYKNLAALATQRKDYISAIESYIEAVKIDNSELTVWYKMGITALKIEDYQLAKSAFEEGLECNPRHWPCLDKIITVMYALNNYMECLYFISKAFEMEIYYDKGHAIRNKIYQEQPSLKTDTEEFFMDCDKELSCVKIDPSEARKYVDEALQMRKRRQELDKPAEPVRLKFPDKLREYSWQCVGETLIDLYDKAKLSDQSISLALRVDVPDYDNVACEKDTMTIKKNTNQDKPHSMSGESQPDEKDIAMETDDREVETAMEIDQEGDKRLEETKDQIEDQVKKSEKKSLDKVEESDGKVDGDEATTTISQTLDAGCVEKANEEKPDKLGQTMSDKDKADYQHDISSSLLEAVSVAHSLLDSLSPMKGAVAQVTGSSSSSFTTPRPWEHAITDKNEMVSKDGSGNNTTSNAKVSENDQKPQSLVKSSSLGFSVSDVQLEDSDCVPDTPDVGTNYCFVKPESSSHNTLLKPNLDLGKKVNVEAVSCKPPVVLTDQPNLPKEIPDIIDLTEMNSDSESESKKVEDFSSIPSTASLPSEIMTSLSVNQSRLTSSPLTNPKPVYTGAAFLSPIQSAKPVISLSPNIVTSAVARVSLGTTSQASSSVTQDYQNKDHEYSKASQKFGSVSIITSSQGPMSMEDSIPVTQPLFKTSDLHMIEASAGIWLDLDDRNLASKKAQKKRKISLATEEIMMYGKRRSARVRNTGKKKEEEHMNVKDLLLALLPSSLKCIQDDDNSIMDSSKEENVTSEKLVSKENNQGTVESKPSFTVWDEVDDVKKFLRELHIKNCGLVDIMNKFLHVIARHWKLKWSDTLCPVYLDVFNCVREHIYMPNALIMYDTPDIIQEVALICLSLAELQVDQWLCDRSKVTGSQSLSPVGKSAQTLLEENIPAYFDDDLLFLKVLCCQADRLGDHWIEHCVRVFWMKSKYAVLRGDIEEAIYSYEKLKDYLDIMKEEYNLGQVVIPNCKMENLITLDLVTSQMDILQKSHCVEETQRLYDMAEYEKVVEILLQTFSQPDNKAKVMKVDAVERQSQLKLLQDAMFKTGNNERSVLWGEESMSEAYLEYKTTENPDNKSSWLKTMIEILSWLQMVLARDCTAVKSLPSAKLVRFSHNLIKLIDKNMSLPESVTEMVIDTVAPWALLYHLIKHEEDKIESMRLKDSGNTEELDDAISSSQMLLNVAHDYLGGRSWCTKSDGSLLLFFMDVLKEKLEQDSGSQEDYQQAFEQCVYCLFGHPNKKAKAKHLQDHNATGITLEWEHAVQVFDYFKPKTVPEFDGYKSETISAELEVLFKRIVLLVPEELRSKFLSHEDVQSYIEGTKDSAPSLREGISSKNQVLEDIYYLLGDYYLKNKESVKAIKFYTHDLCVNPDRLDSWAGMALARMSQLESKLTSAEIKMDAPIYKKSIAALRCFKRATEIDDSNAKLWLEYGTLAYQLHAHASKQIRWKRWFAMEQELVDIAVASKREMLQTALDCFKQASDWNEEEWLHNYMLGKCLEKMRKPVKDVLQYYFQALMNVHEEKAKYPKKIIYAYTTPHLAVEALEMYYRIHAVIFKQLMEHSPDSDELDYKLLVTSMAEANFSPFFLRVEKGQEAKIDRESASSADESSCSAASSPVKKPAQGSVDHTYFRQKSNQESGSALSADSELPNKQGCDTGVNQEDSNIKPTSVVTTMELHTEQSMEEKVTLTTTKTECAADISHEKSEKMLKVSSTSDIENLSEGSEDVLTGNRSNQHLKSDTSIAEKESIDDIVKSAMNYIKDTIERRENKSQTLSQNERAAEKLEERISEKMEVDNEKVHAESGGNNSLQDSSLDEDIFKGICPNAANMSKEKEELCESLLKLPKEDLHGELLIRCRKAFELCLRRFPTHYKSQYRLAQIYSKCIGFKDLEKAHNILFAGSVKWQQLDYMPCPAMFGERKMSKFFQGIWKIPIDEIDRAGSFPSHLNRCIGLALNILREERDCYTLHQVHLQLNRQPDPGKKYLRDAEKKFYALTSHRYTLDAAEERINDMKSITDIEQRHKFLLLFYKIWEHGVHKLNKHVERTNKLLAEAYRVVLRKLETLPHQMLLDQAIRFCKHLMSQKSKSEKQDTRSQGSDSASENKSRLGLKHGTEDIGKPNQHISLENIMKAQTDLSLKKSQTKRSDEERESVLNKTSKSEKQQKSAEEKADDKTDEAIVIDSSDDTDRNTDKESEKIDVKSPVTAVPRMSGQAEPETKAPTVKIKMGLLQAVKRLKPSHTAEDGSRVDTEKTGENMEDELDDAQSMDEELEIPTLDDVVNEEQNSTSFSSSSIPSTSDESSSSDSSSEDEDDNKDGKNDGADADGDNENTEDSSDSSDEEDEDGDDTDERNKGLKDSKTNKISETTEFRKPDIKIIISSSEEDEEEESSDDSQEVDLVSSDDDGAKDDEKDTDYKASEDEEDVVMVSDEEFKSKGRAVVPSPPHRETEEQEEMEVLVENVPDFDPIISSIMFNEQGSKP